ncbi:hypothetical protein AX16_003159 [Volvariella volvacea WC 439]|nr:hypothetical protein AX16_003159 [Volvariella volvacea WC 439]
MRLRLVGSRIRKNVTEGYLSVPPSMAGSYGRSASTGHIFRSSNDTLRDIFASPDASRDKPTTHPVRKRARSFSQSESQTTDTDDDDAIRPDSTNDASEAEHQTSTRPSGLGQSSRSFKPLPKSRRGMMVTQSLPAGALRFGERRVDDAIAPVKELPAEEDWSAETSSSSFQPTLLE